MSSSAQKFAPAVVLFDEIDSIAPSRSAESAQYQVSIVAQLLVLLDGIEARGQIFVLATTNAPNTSTWHCAGQAASTKLCGWDYQTNAGAPTYSSTTCAGSNWTRGWRPTDSPPRLTFHQGYLHVKMTPPAHQLCPSRQSRPRTLRILRTGGLHGCRLTCRQLSSPRGCAGIVSTARVRALARGLLSPNLWRTPCSRCQLVLQPLS
jgi:ATPase family associated with various cellular activities (AAA)